MYLIVEPDLLHRKDDNLEPMVPRLGAALGDAGQNLPLANSRDVSAEVSRPYANHGNGLAGGVRGSGDLQRPDQVEGRANLPDPPSGVS